VFSTADTIVAIATPPGRGGLGVVRMSGPAAMRVTAALLGRAAPLEPRRATFARLASAGEMSGDEVVAVYFPAPRSYTGEDVIEISAHGSPVILNGLLRRAVNEGARLAEPGEFTLRAFLNGKRDLVQAEAVRDLIESVTPLQARAAFDQLDGTLSAAIATIESALFDLVARLEASLDFPDEGFHFIRPDEVADGVGTVLSRVDSLLADAGRGRLVREGAVVAIVGAPNVGKSSLFNALLNASRAIVTDLPGTTRDLLTERVDMGGLSLALMDTAGLRETTDVVEREGVERARQALAVADLVVVVLDGSRPLDGEDRATLAVTAGRRRVVVVNKADLPDAWIVEADTDVPTDALRVSVRTRQGLDHLVGRVTGALAGGEPWRETPRVTNLRHVQLLERVRDALGRGLASARTGTVPEEFILADLQDAQAALEEVTGRRAPDEVLRHIFTRFCVGK
jgi:tRNA modification GTPase